MLQSRTIAIISLFLVACSATTSSVAGTTTDKTHLQELRDALADEEAAATPEPKSEKKEYSYGMNAPEGWRFVSTPDGTRAFVQDSAETGEVVAIIQLFFPPVDGTTVSTLIADMKAMFEKAGTHCSATQPGDNDASESFDMSRAAKDDSEAMAGRSIVRLDPARAGGLIQCVGIWAAVSHDRLAPQASEICASIEAAPQPESSEYAPQPSIQPHSDFVQHAEGEARSAVKPMVVTPAGWIFDERTGVGTKKSPDGTPLGICTIRIVPKMDLTVADHAKALSNSVTTRKDPRMSLRGDTKISSDGNRAILGVTFRKDAASPPRAEGVAIIRVAAGLNDSYELCMANWDPTRPELQAEAEKLCDSFSIVSASSPTAIDL